MERGHPRLQPSRDHVIPESQGGKATIIVCLQCNGIKADMMPDVWAAFMEANPGWWLLSPAELRARRREKREAERTARWGPRRHGRQGSPPAPPVVVPPELVWRLNDNGPEPHVEREVEPIQANADFASG